LSYIEALLDLNTESFVKPTDIKILVYEIGHSKLIRLLHPVIVVHPYIEWNSSFSSLTVSPTPIAVRDGRSIRISFTEVEGQRRVIEVEGVYSAYYLDPLSLALIVPNADVHRIISPLGEKPLRSRLKFFMPCANESYILTEESLDAVTYWDRKVIVKKPYVSVFNTLHPCTGTVFNALTIHSDNIVIVSDGIYGSKAIVDGLLKYLDRVSQLYLLNDFSIAIASENIGMIIESEYRTRVLPRGLIPYVKEGPYIIGLFKPSNYIVLYHMFKNELQNLFPSTCKLLTYNLNSRIIIALCVYASKYVLIAIKPSDKALAMELSSEPLNAELIDNLLMLSYRDRFEIYRISQSMDRIELLCITKPLYSCQRLDDKRVACVDSFGRLIVVNTRRICNKPKVSFLRSKKSTCIELEDTSKYVSILGTSIPNSVVRRLSLARTIIELDNLGYQRLQLTISGTLHDTSLLLNDSQPVYAKHNFKGFLPSGKDPELILIKSNTRLYIYNNSNLQYCVFDSQGINYIEQAFLAVSQSSISEIYRVYRASSSPQIEFWKKVDPVALRYIELPNNVELALNKDLICVSTNLPVNDHRHQLEIELVCEKGVYTLRDRCIPANVCRDLLTSLICIALGNKQRYCIPISTSPRIVVTENESMEPTIKNVLSDVHVIIPRNCTSIDNVSLVMDKNLTPVLVLSIVNRCRVPITIISVYALSTQRILLEPYQSAKVSLPVNSLTKLFRKPIIIAFELSKPKTYTIDIDLKHMFTLAHRIALKLSLLLGVRRWLR